MQGLVTGPKQGVLTKHDMPRFPTLTEMEYILGCTLSYDFPCQEASVGIVDRKSGALFSGINNPQYRKPFNGVMETGAYAVAGAANFWYETGGVAANLPAAGISFLLGGYTQGVGAGGSPQLGIGFIDENDGSPLLRLGPFSGTSASWHAQFVDDSLQNFEFTIGTTAPMRPLDKIPRAFVFLWDASDTKFYYYLSGLQASATGATAWSGSITNYANPGFHVGGWPGVGATDQKFRSVFYAKGATLNGKGPSLASRMRALGW